MPSFGLRVLIFCMVAVPALSGDLFAQGETITKVLNKALKDERKMQQKDPGNYCGELFDIVLPYQIGGNKLSVTIKKRLPENVGYLTEVYEVVLDSVVNIVKDINILFETFPDAVTLTRHTVYTNAPATTEVFKSALFFLQLCHEKNNEAFADKLINAFQKEGYTLKKSHWYDRIIDKGNR
jgi:hypothetical protein